MIFIWTGWGILAPVLIIAGWLGTAFGVEAIVGANYADTHVWVSGVGLALGGALCWLTGKWLYGRSARVLLDPATGREVNVGGSHTWFFIPMHWLGILVIVGGSAAGTPQFATVAEAQQAASAAIPNSA